ncbi:MAG TPA: LysE family transporter, partial [Clostridia bacterium]|nr:LysE family transporter [Clostridia bacterium]
MFLKGLRFGMLMQLAIGPVCIFIFNMASNNGFLSAEAGVAGVTIIDLLYAAMAVLGISAFIRNKSTQKIFKILSSVIIAYFGLSIVLGTLEIKILPVINIFNGNSASSSFVQVLLLTASNPLTIIFFMGVFSAKITETNMNEKNINIFAAGTVTATFLFMTIIASVGAIAHKFISVFIIDILNIMVGLVLIYFAITKVLKKD